MIKSLRWRLQIWHALVLVAVVASFGSVVYQLQWQARLQQLDTGLDQAADDLSARLRRLFQRPNNNNHGPWGIRRILGDRASPNAPSDALNPENGRQDWWIPERYPSAPPDGNRHEGDRRRPPESPGRPPEFANRPSDPGNLRPEPGGPPSEPLNREPGNRDANNRGPRQPFPFPFEIPDEVQFLFERDHGDSMYFFIWAPDGHLVKKSDEIADVAYPALRTTAEGLPTRLIRTSDLVRETIHVTSSGINILVGRHLEPELKGHHQFGVWLLTVGTIVVVSGLLGGWWLSGRAIYPIVLMTRTAAAISAQNLSERINLKETDSELGQLGTVLNRTFDRIQSAFEQQIRFTADASHELRTPLAVILARTELALSRPREAEDYRQALEANRRAAQRMKSLLDGLLWLARYDAGETTMLQDLVSLPEIATECLELVKPLAEPKQIQLQRRMAAVSVRGSRERLSQVITNLLTNAIRYNQPQGRVLLEILSEGKTAVLRVIDTGIGIPADSLPHIFDRFYRVDEARSRDDGGSGLGLAICRTIVQLHGGTIAAQSTPGAGTTVEVRLPLVVEASENSDATPASFSILNEPAKV